MTRRELLAAPLAIPFLAVAPDAKRSAGLRPLELADAWIGRRQTAESLYGRVCLLDVFTFECINCVRVTPGLKRLYGEYSRTQLAVVAIHTPEVPSYQSRLRYLSAQAREASLPWPIAVDNHYRIWNAYGISAWPTQLIFDRRSNLRATVVGDGRDDEVSRIIRTLVRE